VGPDPDDPRRSVLATTKCNLTEQPSALGYAVQTVNGIPVVAWGEECGLTANDLVPTLKSVRGPTRVEGCAEWLVDFLDEFAWPDEELQAASREAGFSPSNLRDAKIRLRNARLPLRAKAVGKGGQWWNWIGRKRPPDRPESLAISASGDPPGEEIRATVALPPTLL
jgi:hypothetical protein